MGQLDYLKYQVKMYHLENDTWNFYVSVNVRTGERWTQPQKVGNGTASTEEEAIKLAQEKATADRSKREKEETATKTVALK